VNKPPLTSTEKGQIFRAKKYNSNLVPAVFWYLKGHPEHKKLIHDLEKKLQNAN